MVNTITQQRLNLALVISFLAAFVTACGSQQIAPTAANRSAAPITNEDLTSMKWQLVSISQPGETTTTLLRSGPPVSRYTFLFQNGRLAITGGCNNLSGPSKLAINNRIALGPMASTKKACQQSLMESDNEILSYISGITDYSLNGRALTLTTAFKQRLILKGTPTSQTRYGGAGVRKFIEITNSTQGIQWREAKYNKSWIRIKDNAAWETVYPGIQGFIPANNRRYIVRIHEHIDPQTQRAVWVKDMVTTNGVLR